MPPKLEVDGTEVLISPSIFCKYRYKLTLFALFGGAESLTYVRRPPASAICRLTYLLTYLYAICLLNSDRQNVRLFKKWWPLSQSMMLQSQPEVGIFAHACEQSEK